MLFFDAAGTLLHPARPVGETYAALASQHGALFDDTALHLGFRTAFASMGERTTAIPTNGDDRIWWREIVRRSIATQPKPLPSTFPFDAYFEKLYLHYARPEAWKAFPETAAALKRLRNAGYRLAVLSNWDSRLRPVLEGLGLNSFFEALFISAEIGSAKPDPQMYLHALSALECEPQFAAMIGDEEKNDIEPPQRLGMGAFLVHPPHQNITSVLGSLIVEK